MMAWTSPGFTVRSTPRRISLSSTRACRFLISSISVAVLNQNQSKVVLKPPRPWQPGGLLERVDEGLTSQARCLFSHSLPTDIFPHPIGHRQDQPGSGQLGRERD